MTPAACGLDLQQKEKPGNLGWGDGRTNHQQRVGLRAKVLKKTGTRRKTKSGSNLRRKEMEVEKPGEKEPCPSCLGTPPAPPMTQMRRVKLTGP